MSPFFSCVVPILSAKTDPLNVRLVTFHLLGISLGCGGGDDGDTTITDSGVSTAFVFLVE